VPILVLSARGQERDKVQALDLGADDFVSKPFGVDELLARVRVALRHVARLKLDTAGAAFRLGELEVNLADRRVLLGGEEIHLTPIEFRLLQTLVHHAGKVLTQRQLLKEVWGPNSLEQPQYLRVYMAQLRRKLEPDPARPRYLLTEPGVGYRLAAE
jgi:two-component system, OmpR family, KDP operon response regulator KdpE